MWLSIIIPVYNVEKYISKCLTSAINQGIDPNDYEIIIVNDGSTDGSYKIAEHFATLYTHVKLIDKENGGVSSARNVGLNLAAGKYVYFLDSDDFLISNSFKKIIETCESHNLDVLTFESSSFSSAASTDNSISTNTNFDTSSNQEKLSDVTTGEVYVANMNYGGEVWLYVINHKFLKTSGIKFVEGKLLEDAIFTISVFLVAKRMAHLKLDAHRYRVAAGSAMTNKESSHYLQIIRDLLGAAIAFDPIIKKLKSEKANPGCIERLKARQQSFVFFSMIRMLKSTMTLNEVKQRINEVIVADAYPLDAFLGKDYNGIKYQLLVRLFNTERRFYFFFQLVNPVLKLK
jgi:glycosyltransferase involved in cell wall biosynthesis